MTGEHRAGEGVGIRLAPALLVLSLLPIAAAPVVPTQDGASHLYNAWVLTRLTDPSLPLAKTFYVVPFVPNWGGTAPLVALLAFLPPTGAETVFYAILVLTWVSGWLRMADRSGGDPWVAGAAGAILAHGFLFAMGFTAYELTVAVGLWTVSWLMGWREREPTVGRLVLASLLFALLFFAHLAGALITAALWTMQAFVPMPRTRTDWRRTLLVVAPAAVVVPGLAILQSVAGPGLPNIQYDPKPWGMVERLEYLLSGKYWEAFGGGDVLVGVGMLLLVALAVALRRRSSARQPRAQMLAITGAVAGVAYLLVPWQASGGAYIPERLLPFALILPLPWAVQRGQRHVARWRTIALAVLATALWIRTVEYRDWGARQLSLAGSIGPFPRGRLVLTGSYAIPGTAVDPLFHLWARVALDHQAVALDDYEARLAGLFPVAFRPWALSLAERARNNPAAPPPGVIVFGWR